MTTSQPTTAPISRYLAYMCLLGGLFLLTSGLYGFDPRPLDSHLFVDEVSTQHGVRWQGMANPSVVLRITDPGVHPDIAFEVPKGRLVDLHLTSAGHITATNDRGTLWESQDGGRRWQRSLAGPGRRIAAVAWGSAELAIAVGPSGNTYRTEDGGVSWQRVATEVGEDLFGVAFVDPQQVWVSGEHGRLLRSDDSGLTWQPIVSGTKRALRDIDFDALGQNGWAVGDGNAIVRTRNGGQRWYEEDAPTGVSLDFQRVCVESSRLTVISTDWHVLRSEDEGQHWALVPEQQGAPAHADVLQQPMARADRQDQEWVW
ncbi:MAG: YCF48-related protein [Pseudomonadota bacterium]